METIKLYDLDSHLRTFEGKILSCEKSGEGFDIILDRTAFFPEGGGQHADTGKIGDANVLDVFISDGIIHHKTDIPLEAGNEYICSLDWDKRFRRMQNHSGEHIVSGLIHKHFGFDNVGFHMGHEDVTLDINGILSDEDVEMVEHLANLAVAENVVVLCEYPDSDELCKIDYRSKLELKEKVRIVTIEGYDSCACCAPHVSRTGEIGIIKLLDHGKYKGGMRIHMLCGLDALDDYNQRYRMIADSAKSLSVKQNELGEAVTRLEEEIGELKRKNYGLRCELLNSKIEKIAKTGGNICLFEEDITPGDMRKLIGALLEKSEGICAVFNGSDEKGYTFVASGKNVDLREFMSDMRRDLNAKGGGSEEMIQGSILASCNEIKKYFGV